VAGGDHKAWNFHRRVQVFSGTFTIDSAAGKRCEVMVEIPLAINK